MIVFALLILAGFAGGFAVSSFVRSQPYLLKPRSVIADFQVQIPAGETIVTITSRDKGDELGRVVVQRHGNRSLAFLRQNGVLLLANH